MPTLTSLQTKLFMGLLAVVLFVFLVWRVYDIGYNRGDRAARIEWRLVDADRSAAIERVRLADQAVSDAIDSEHLAERDKLLKQKADLEKRLQYERAQNRVYRDCLVPPDGVRLYNDAIRAESHH